MIKDSEEILNFVLGIVVACLLFWGIITAIKKSFSIPQPQKIDSSQGLQQQRRRSQEVITQQKKLMDDQRQKLRDMRRK